MQKEVRCGPFCEQIQRSARLKSLNYKDETMPLFNHGYSNLRTEGYLFIQTLDHGEVFVPNVNNLAIHLL